MKHITDSLSKCTTFSHIDENGNIIEKPKRAYKTDKEAIKAAQLMNLKAKQIHKLVAYKCPICQFYHIGKSNRLITEKDRNKIKNNLCNIK